MNQREFKNKQIQRAVILNVQILTRWVWLFLCLVEACNWLVTAWTMDIFNKNKNQNNCYLGSDYYHFLLHSLSGFQPENSVNNIDLYHESITIISAFVLLEEVEIWIWAANRQVFRSHHYNSRKKFFKKAFRGTDIILIGNRE